MFFLWVITVFTGTVNGPIIAVTLGTVRIVKITFLNFLLDIIPDLLIELSL